MGVGRGGPAQSDRLRSFCHRYQEGAKSRPNHRKERERERERAREHQGEVRIRPGQQLLVNGDKYWPVRHRGTSPRLRIWVDVTQTE